MKNTFRRKTILGLAATVALMTAGAASADMSVKGPVTNWRLQTYGGGKVVLWYTGSSCTSGQLMIDPNESLDQHKLMAAMVLAAKANGSNMEITYQPSNGTCFITSIAVDGP